ncbi:hypothetical protein C2134_17970 [Chromobacterium sinusclupearum]|uniref:Uncharacterized protein n=1 Tax=Chromobacterium sinusclupearum TaxID=2077146 RepID=A0A2K4MJH9_9NEIS|nr:hypothetical protein [Chromobacterium sinusclupearum]POA97267.1 hypothetical protein C2134_17970 [Chromobacterium sinusclupearum]
MFVKTHKGRIGLLSFGFALIVFGQLISLTSLDLRSWLGGFMVALLLTQLERAIAGDKAEKAEAKGD